MKNFFIIILGILSPCLLVKAQSSAVYLSNQDNFCLSSSTFQGNWELIGPKSFVTQSMGRIDPVWVDPDDENHILAGSLSGGLFEKISTGDWVCLTNKLPGAGVHDIAVYKNGSQTSIVISIAVDDKRYRPGHGIYYSLDGGATWIFDEEYYNLADHPLPIVNRTRFIHGTDGLISIVNHKVLRKASLSNPNSHWEDITPDDMPVNIDLFDLEMSPSDADVFWVAGSNLVGGTTGAGLFYTLDGGDNFINLTPAFSNNPSFFNVDFPSNDDAFVYYFTGSTAWINHYHLNNEVYELQPDPTNPGNLGIWFEMSPLGGLDTMYFGRSGGNDFRSSYDGGATVNAGVTTLHPDVRYIYVYPANGHVFVGNDGGVSKSTNGGVTGSWVNLNASGLNVTEFYGLSGVEEQPEVLFAGAQDNQNWRFDNGIPTQFLTGLDGYETESYQNAQGEVVLFYQAGSGKDGPAATNVKRRVEPAGASNDVTPDITGSEEYSKPVHKHSNGKFYLGMDDLYISLNDDPVNGNDYQKQGLDAENYNGDLDAVSAIEVSPIDANRIYVAYWGSGNFGGNEHFKNQLFYKPGLGSQWVNRTPGFGSSCTGCEPGPNSCGPNFPTCFNSITGIVTDPEDYERVWICYRGFDYDGDGTLGSEKKIGVMYSDDAGITWHHMNSGLPNFPINCIRYQPGTDDILYVGTDAGVFRWVHASGQAAWVGYWECFSNGLPACMVRDIEINHCTQKLRIATLGRGLWESNLYPQTLVPPRQQNTAVWNSDRREIQSFTIPANQTLTITNCTVGMAANTFIKVEPGGALILDGCTLTNSCGYLWSGIQVLGDPTKKQTPASNQGVLIMKNGAKIENAYVAAMADEAYYSAPDYTFPNGISNNDGTDEHGGGIIQIQFSQTDPVTISNCRKGIGFGPYHSPLVSGVEPANKSYIYGAVFENTGTLNMPYSAGYTTEFISMWQVHGVGVSGNKFYGPTGENQTVSQVKGIVSTDAGYSVSDYCISQNIPCSNTQVTEFHNLYRGVYSVVSDPSAAARLLSISNCTFDNVRRSVYLSGHQNASVLFNTIDLNQTSNDTAYGIYTNGCTFYSIEENTIGGAVPIRPLSYGIIINNSVGPNNPDDDNLVYKNWLNNLQYGTVSMRRNANTTTGPESGFHGLEFRCNEYRNVKYSIAAFPIPNSNQKATLKFAQGSSSDPAGNYFELNTGQYSLFKQQIPDPIYYYHDLPYYDPTDFLYAHFSPSATTITTISCPSHFSGGGGQQRMEAYSPAEGKLEIQAYLDAADSLLKIIDGGNTAQLISLANDLTVSSYDLKAELLGVGPYISDTVLNTSLTRSNPMKNSDTKEVILNNSPVTDTVYSVLEEEKPVVAENAEVLNAQEGVSDRSNLLAEAGELYLQAHVALHDLRDYYEENDSVNSFYQYLVGEQRNEYAIPYALQFNDIETAQTMIDGMSESDLKAFYQLAHDKQAGGSSVYALDPDELDWMHSIANKESVSGLMALHLLSIVDGTGYYEDIPVIDEEEITAGRLTDQPTIPSGNWMQPAPNPVNTEMIILFSPEFSSNGASLILSDVFGQMVWSYFVTDDFGSVSIPANNLSSGLYYLQLKTGGELIETQEVVVNR